MQAGLDDQHAAAGPETGLEIGQKGPLVRYFVNHPEDQDEIGAIGHVGISGLAKMRYEIPTDARPIRPLPESLQHPPLDVEGNDLPPAADEAQEGIVK